MPLWKAVGSTVALTFVNLNVATCRSPTEGGGAEPAPKDEAKVVVLNGVDTSSLTPREQKEWSTYVSELLAPCPDQPVSLAQCVKESRPCTPCLPAARFLVERVTRGGARSQVEQAFRLRFAPDQVKTIDEGDSPWKGAKDAPVTIVEWADFECPYCGAASPIIDKLVEQYPGNVRIVFKNYPLASHENSELTARASVAAGRQGKFWEMHAALFANQQAGLTRENVLKLARDIGLDERKLTTDLTTESVADSVNTDRKQAEKLGLKGTPMIYVNGRHFELEQFSLLEDLNPWIELEIEQRTGKKVTARALDGGKGASPPPGGLGAEGPSGCSYAFGIRDALAMKAAGEEGGGCFPTGRHYPGIAHLLRIVAQGLIDGIDAGTVVADLPLVSIDTETTGTDFAVDRVLEIALVVWDRGEVTARHRWLVNPGRPIPKEAFDVHGISDDDVKDMPPFSAVAEEILAALEGKVPLAYNAEFDRQFLQEELGRAGIAGRTLPPAARRGIEWVDPLTWARELQKEEKSRSLTDVAERLGVALEKAHSAVHDAEAAVRVLERFFSDARVPKTYGAFIQEQKRLGRMHDEERQYWRRG